MDKKPGEIWIYDTRAGEERRFEPVHPGRVGIYVCGMTPYAPPHIGHARFPVVWDVIRRHLERRGYLVTLVENFTDVDDKLIERAAVEGTSVAELAARHAAEFLQAMKALRVRPPDVMPRATDHIGAIVALMRRLMAHRYAYARDGDVYFRVGRCPDYGLLARRHPDALRPGARLEVNPAKEDPRDFALWKHEQPGEPSWPTPFGPGRPGWHIECSAMAHEYLGPVIDMHGGGLDLIFPHHENERVQSEAGYGVPRHVRYWVHNGLVTTGGIKMSKSLDNGRDLTALIDRYGPMTVRGYLLSVHYRSPLEFSTDALEEFGRARERIARLWEQVADAEPPRHLVGGDAGDVLVSFPGRILDALDADFNTARAWAEVFEMVRAANSLIQSGGDDREAARGFARRNLLLVDEALGVLDAEAGPPATLPPGIAELVARRSEARAAKDWAAADRLRAELVARGYVVEDTAEGTVVRPRPGL